MSPQSRGLGLPELSWNILTMPDLIELQGCRGQEKKRLCWSTFHARMECPRQLTYKEKKRLFLGHGSAGCSLKSGGLIALGFR